MIKFWISALRVFQNTFSGTIPHLASIKKKIFSLLTPVHVLVTAILICIPFISKARFEPSSNLLLNNRRSSLNGRKRWALFNKKSLKFSGTASYKTVCPKVFESNLNFKRLICSVYTCILRKEETIFLISWQIFYLILVVINTDFQSLTVLR